MTYVSWAALYEGSSDAAYFGVLLPRMMDELVLERGVRASTIPATAAITLRRGDVTSVAAEACAAADAFHIVFIHADTGGRGLQRGLAGRSAAYCEAMHALCELDPRRCITIEPNHETEAWLLCDPAAVTSAPGYRGPPTDLELPASPQEAEALVDPKATLTQAMAAARGRRRPESAGTLYPAIAQRQSLAALRESASFRSFEARLVEALQSLGCL
jgi:hypothetical protein